MALIAMAVWDTPENGRHVCTAQTLDSLRAQVDLSRHHVFIVDNASTCPRTQERLHAEFARGGIEVIHLPENIGTARAINRAWKYRVKGECAVKMDNDVVVHQKDWPDLMEEVLRREPRIGIASLKRNDLIECPTHPHPWFKSELVMLPHKPGERWIVVEAVNHCMGTVQLYSGALLDKIGGLYQMQDEGSLYGYDDSLAAIRCKVAGFVSVFIPHVPIDHVDNGGTPYTAEKSSLAGEWQKRYEAVRDEYLSGARPIFWEDKD